LLQDCLYLTSKATKGTTMDSLDIFLKQLNIYMIVGVSIMLITYYFVV
jgi:hypothetical protein